MKRVIWLEGLFIFAVLGFFMTKAIADELYYTDFEDDNGAFVQEATGNSPVPAVFSFDPQPSASSSPGNEQAFHGIDGNFSTKYLNFAKLNTGFIVTPSSGDSVVRSISLATANDAIPRDPSSYILYGTNDAILSTDHSLGNSEDWTEIASGDLSLPDSRNTPGTVVNFPNARAYSSYRLVFPTVKDAGSANSMQIAEVQFFDEEEAGGNSILAAGDPIIPIHLATSAGDLGTWSMEGDDTGPATNFLTSPEIELEGAWGVRVIFDHRYSIEAEWDAVALEVSIDGGDFEFIPNTAFTVNGYTYSDLKGNHVFKGGEGFNGESEGYSQREFITSIVDLGDLNAEENIVIRFVGAWDEAARGLGLPNWEIDTFTVEAISDPSILLSEDFVEDDGGFIELAEGNSPIPSLYNEDPGTWSMEGDDQGPATNYITSPEIDVPITAGIEVSFAHRYSIEPEWDGTALQYSIDGDEFQTVPTDAFSENGYSFSNLIGNHVLKGGDGFNGNSEGYFAGDFITSTAKLGSIEAGSSLSIRFLGAWDCAARGVGIPNWEIDSVVIRILDDLDGDGMPDYYEDENDLDKAVDDSAEDPDSDGLTNIEEFIAGTNPQEADTDNDGLNDNVETGTGNFVNALNTGTDPLNSDTDSDGLLDGVETNTGTFVDADDSGTDPHTADTDEDSINDGTEVERGSDPLDGEDFPLLWVVRNAKSNSPLNSIANTRDLFDSFVGHDVEVVTIHDTINFRDNANGPFPDPKPFPLFGAQDVNQDDFAIKATGTLFITEPGIYTFGFNSDDGGGFYIDGEPVVVFDANRGSATSLGSVDLSFGAHEMEFLFWERGGGAQCQLFVHNEKGDFAGAGFSVSDYHLLETSYVPSGDSDNDDLPDAWEEQFFDNLGQGPEDDPDNDGSTNMDEFELGTIPNDPDTDDDGLNDGVEDGSGTFVNSMMTGTDPKIADSDGDGLLDGVETNTGNFVSENNTGTNPHKADTDEDLVSDGRELVLGTDPTVPQARPKGYVQDFDGFPDGTTDLNDGTAMYGPAASVVDGRLQLTRDGQGLGFSSFTIPTLEGSSGGWVATFDLEISDGPGANEPADGLSFNYGNFDLGVQGSGEEGMGAVDGNDASPLVTENLSFEIDTWRNGDPEQGVNIAEKVEGEDINLEFINGRILDDGTSVSGPVTIVYDPVNGASFKTEGLLTNADFEDVPLTFVGDDSYNFGISARVGGANQDVFIDNLVISIGSGAAPLQITEIEKEGDEITLTWNSKPNRVYLIERSEDMENGEIDANRDGNFGLWEEIDDGILSDGEFTSFTDQVPEGIRKIFWRVTDMGVAE